MVVMVVHKRTRLVFKSFRERMLDDERSHRYVVVIDRSRKCLVVIYKRARDGFAAVFPGPGNFPNT